MQTKDLGLRNNQLVQFEASAPPHQILLFCQRQSNLEIGVHQLITEVDILKFRWHFSFL